MKFAPDSSAKINKKNKLPIVLIISFLPSDNLYPLPTLIKKLTNHMAHCGNCKERQISARIPFMIKEQVSAEEKRIVPRYPLPKEKVKIIFENKEKVFAIRDLSMKGLGIGLIEPSEGALFSLGAVCKAELKLGKESFALMLSVRRLAPWSIGCTFEDMDAGFEKKIADFLNPLRIGRSLQKVDISPNDFARGVSTWYHGDSATDLYFWNDARGGVSRALFCMNGSFWEWSTQEKSRTGKFERQQDDEVLFHYDTTALPELKQMAVKILERAEVLDYRLVNFLKDQM